MTGVSQPNNTGASEAIRIAEAFFPKDFYRQRDLAREIMEAINLCEAEFGQEIIRHMEEKAK